MKKEQLDKFDLKKLQESKPDAEKFFRLSDYLEDLETDSNEKEEAE